MRIHKLSDAKAKKIRLACLENGATVREMAFEYGTGEIAIRRVLTGQTYPNAGGPIKAQNEIELIPWRIVGEERVEYDSDPKRILSRLAYRFCTCGYTRTIPLTEKHAHAEDCAYGQLISNSPKLRVVGGG